MQSSSTKLNIEKDSKKARLFEFDILKLFAIFLVLCGHSIMHLSEADKHENIIYQIIYSFHMPLFMTVAGYFSNNSLALPFTTLLTKKFWQLIYPCLTFGILFFLSEIFIFKGEIASSNFVSYLFGCLWFLKSCFLCFIIMKVSLKISNNKTFGIILAVLISQIIPTFKLPWMLPFFALGFILHQRWDIFLKYKSIIFLSSLILFILIFNIYSESTSLGLISLKHSLLGGDMTTLFSYLKFHSLRMVIGFLGVSVIMSIVMFISKKIKEDHKLTKHFLSLGRQTMGIYVMQTLLLEIVLSKCVDLTGVNLYLFNFLIVPTISIIVLYLSILILKTITKFKMLNKVLWGKS